MLKSVKSREDSKKKATLFAKMIAKGGVSEEELQLEKSYRAKIKLLEKNL